MSIYTPELKSVNVESLRAAGILEKAGIIKRNGNWRFAGRQSGRHIFTVEGVHYIVDLITGTYHRIST